MGCSDIALSLQSSFLIRRLGVRFPPGVVRKSYKTKDLRRWQGSPFSCVFAKGAENGDVIMGLNEHQRGHETPKTLFNALRLSPPRGVIAHVSPQFPTCRNPGKQSYFRPTSFPPPTLAQFGDKKRAETSKFLPPRTLRPVSNTFRRVAELEKTRISGPTFKRSPTFGPVLATKSEPTRQNSCRRYPFAPFPTRFAVLRRWKKLVFPANLAENRPRWGHVLPRNAKPPGDPKTTERHFRAQTHYFATEIPGSCRIAAACSSGATCV